MNYLPERRSELKLHSSRGRFNRYFIEWKTFFYFVFKPGGTAHTAPLHLLQGRFLFAQIRLRNIFFEWRKKKWNY
jgi:hypothetical protein